VRGKVAVTVCSTAFVSMGRGTGRRSSASPRLPIAVIRDPFGIAHARRVRANGRALRGRERESSPGADSGERERDVSMARCASGNELIDVPDDLEASKIRC
jgi:hypothetical protein